MYKMPTKPDSDDPEQHLSGTLQLGIYISFLQVLPSVQGHLRTVQEFLETLQALHRS